MVSATEGLYVKTVSLQAVSKLTQDNYMYS